MKKSSDKLQDYFISLPSGIPPKYLLTLKNKEVYRTGLNFYNAYTSISKLKKLILYYGYSVLKITNSFGILGNSDDNNLSNLRKYLETKNNLQKTFNLYVPSYNKVIIQYIDYSGKCEKIVKVALSKAGEIDLQNEANNLNILNRYSFKFFEIPKVLNRGIKSELFFVEYTCPEYYKPLEKNDYSERIIKILGELFNTTRSFSMKISDSALFKKLKQKNDISGIERLRVISKETLSLYGDGIINTEIPMGAVHYDFKPWNMLINLKNNKLVIVDWEFMTTQGFPLWDAFSYLLFTYFTWHYDVAPKRAMKHLISHLNFLNMYIKEINVDKKLISTLLPLYLLNLLSISSLWQRWTENETRPTRIAKSIRAFLEYILEKQYYRTFF